VPLILKKIEDASQLDFSSSHKIFYLLFFMRITYHLLTRGEARVLC
jgi:hypothetical protein